MFPELDNIIEQYENARADGLCHEGAWEIVLGLLQNLDVPDAVIQQLEWELR